MFRPSLAIVRLYSLTIGSAVFMVKFVIVMMRSHASCDILVVPIGLDGGTRFYFRVRRGWGGVVSYSGLYVTWSLYSVWCCFFICACRRAGVWGWISWCVGSAL